ncbi:MAG TPA: deoxyribose-phosphate aldolase [Bryobacteraceae bacterium]|nr:deoxyribose-phosphate aldolase [Bryobacteraceae bacterium]
MDDREHRTLAASITNHILSCPSRAEDGHYPCGWECTGCRQRNAEACAERTGKVVEAGAARVSSCLGVARHKPGVAGLIDHTLLKPEATRSDILRICREARQFGFASVCINPCWVPTAVSELAGSPVKVCTVAGFPLGASTAAAKRTEAEEALAGGAREVDMVINVGALRGGEYEVVDREIRAVAEACHRAGAIVKTILETAFLDDRQKAVACVIAKMAGADFVKTSTGFGPAGATAEDVALMRLVVGAKMGVKAAGGIRTLEDLRRMVAAGATRIGASASVKIAEAAGA